MFGGKKKDEKQPIKVPVVPGKTYLASDIVNDVTIAGSVKGYYTIIRDTSFMSNNFDNMIKALNLMARAGWRLANTVIESERAGQTMYCVMEKLPKVKPAATDDLQDLD